MSTADHQATVRAERLAHAHRVAAAFGQPPYHLLALSGGKDSTALALAMKEREPGLNITYYCTPTGNELPDMFEWWKRLGKILGKPIVPVMHTTLFETIERNRCLPNFRLRFCTKEIKILPARRVLKVLTEIAPVTHYVGLRADEESRLGGSFDDIEGVTNRFPFRDWGWGLAEVMDCLDRHGVASCLPERTDCALCYHQQIGEWWRLWKNHPEEFAKGVAIETQWDQTFRTPGRDSWPVSMADLGAAFAAGRIPKSEQQLPLFSRSTMNGGACRVCSL